MTAASAYRSTHPDVLTWWATMEADRAAFHERLNEIRVRFPGYGCMVTTSQRGGRLVGLGIYGEGVGINKEILPPPSDAWRTVDKRGQRWYTPYKNHRKDPELVELMQVSWQVPTPWPGNMPHDVWGEGNRVYTPGWREVDGEVWITWGVSREWVDPDPDFRDRQMMGSHREPVDHEVWQPAKLADYYAAIGE